MGPRSVNVLCQYFNGLIVIREVIPGMTLGQKILVISSPDSVSWTIFLLFLLILELTLSPGVWTGVWIARYTTLHTCRSNNQLRN